MGLKLVRGVGLGLVDRIGMDGRIGKCFELSFRALKIGTAISIGPAARVEVALSGQDARI